jgi:hypothetical protein
MGYVEKQTIKVDSDGVIINTDTVIETTKHVTHDEFIQVYLQDITGLMGIASKGEFFVTLWLWKMSSFLGKDSTSNFGNMVTVGEAARDIIRQETGLTLGTIKNIIAGLVQKGIILKTKYRATYYLNPKYFFKGDLKARAQAYKRVQNYVITDSIQPSDI